MCYQPESSAKWKSHRSNEVSELPHHLEIEVASSAKSLAQQWAVFLREKNTELMALTLSGHFLLLFCNAATHWLDTPTGNSSSCHTGLPPPLTSDLEHLRCPAPNSNSLGSFWGFWTSFMGRKPKLKAFIHISSAVGSRKLLKVMKRFPLLQFKSPCVRTWQLLQLGKTQSSASYAWKVVTSHKSDWLIRTQMFISENNIYIILFCSP